MTTYQVKITVDPYWVTDFDKNGFQLVMARAVANSGSSEPTYNVVASTNDVTPIMIVSWEDRYQMTASTTKFQNGIKLEDLSGIEGISFGETYTLTDWANYNVAKDPEAPADGFGFRNHLKASVVILQDVAGSTDLTPIYISPDTLPPGFAGLEPQPKVAFWFQANLSTAEMVVLDKSDLFEVDLSGSPSAHIKYDKDGFWSRVSSNSLSKQIDYRNVRPAQNVPRALAAH